MIIARSPLRISLGGGGTDLPSYYKEHGGFLIAAAIDKYVYATVTRPFTPGIYLKYSSLEQVQQVIDVKHPIIRECLKEMNLRTPQVEITTLADIPSGTGLGSSGRSPVVNEFTKNNTSLPGQTEHLPVLNKLRNRSANRSGQH